MRRFRGKIGGTPGTKRSDRSRSRGARDDPAEDRRRVRAPATVMRMLREHDEQTTTATLKPTA